MATDSVPAVYGLNKFLWDRIESAGILTALDYGGLIPIVPTQETAALRQAIDEQAGVKSAPYIVYSWYNNGFNQDWFRPVDTVVYVINSTDGKKLRELVLLIIDCFKRYDESALAVNEFIFGSDLSDEYKAYDYKSILLVSANGGQPTALDNEPMEALVTVRVQYTNERDDKPL